MRLIDADTAKVKVRVWEGHDFQEAYMCEKTLLEDNPTVDAVKVVRCKDCKYLNIINKAPLDAYCGKSNYIFNLFEEDTREHFCSWGERKEHEE